MRLIIISFLEIQNGNYGLLNIYTGTVLEPEYTFMLKINGKNAIEAVNPNGIVDIYSKEIEKVLSMPNAVIEDVNDDYTMIFSDTEMSYIDINGEVVPNTQVYPLHNIFAFNENGKWGYKKSTGEVVLEPKYDLATDLNEFGFAGIMQDGQWGVVDSNGDVLRQPTFEIDTYYLPTFVGEDLLELSDTYHCLELE